MPRSAVTWLAVDRVHDPMNLGAIIRSAHYFGISRILISPHDTCGLTPVVSKASSGAMELINITSVKSMAACLQAARTHGWDVVGAAAPESSSLHVSRPNVKVVDCRRWQIGTPTILLLGNEGHGLSEDIEATCTQFVAIHGAHPSQLHGGVDSLNVGVAAGVLLHRITSMGM
jgi:21S rRNA (GM2251-2'-O)-methyltransferase